jgi:ribonuclease HI
MSKYNVYVDGSSRGNPGPGGWACILKDVQTGKEIEFAGYCSDTTNNRMEIMAVIYGIKAIISNIQNGALQGTTQINVFSDSDYCCNAISKNWINKWAQNNWMTSGFQGSKPKPVKNRDLWEQIIALQTQLRSMNINMNVSHVNGHSGNELNEKADQLAVAASKNSTSHLIDEGYEKAAS